MPILSRSASASALTSAGTASVISPISTSPSPMPAQVAELMRPLPGAAKGAGSPTPFLFALNIPGSGAEPRSDGAARAYFGIWAVMPSTKKFICDSSSSVATFPSASQSLPSAFSGPVKG